MARKVKQLTIQEKLKVIEAVETRGDKSQASIAAERGIAASTLSTILKNKEIIKSRATSWNGTKSQFRQRPAEFPDVEYCLYKWYTQCSGNNISLNGPLLKEAANYLGQSLGHTKFRASNGWLNNFKKRHAITFRTICDEAFNVDSTCIKSTLNVKDISFSDYVQVDETILTSGNLFEGEIMKETKIKEEEDEEMEEVEEKEIEIEKLKKEMKLEGLDKIKEELEEIEDDPEHVAIAPSNKEARAALRIIRLFLESCNAVGEEVFQSIHNIEVVIEKNATA